MHGLGVFTALHTDSKSLQHRDTWLAAVKNRRRLTKVTKFENILRADKEVLWFNIWKKNEALTICFKCCPTTWIRNMNTRQQYTFFTASVSLLWQYFVLANYSWCVERLNQHAHVHHIIWTEFLLFESLLNHKSVISRCDIRPGDTSSPLCTISFLWHQLMALMSWKI